MRAHPKIAANVFLAAAAAWLVMITGVLMPGGALGQPPVFSVDVDGSRASNLLVPLNKSRVIQLQAPVKKISVGNPEIADILTLRARQLYVLGKSLGTTNVLLWDNKDELIAAINIEVTHDLDGLRAQMSRLMPGESLDLGSAQGALILSGKASSAIQMDAAIRLAQSFSGESGVVNMMSVAGAQQVMIEIKVAEIARTLGKSFGVDLNAAHNRSTRWSVGAVGGGALVDPGLDLVAGYPLDIGDRGIFGNFMSNHFAFNSVLNAARQNGMAKILAEPTLTTLSGQEAVFLSGGEFPIPVPRGDEGITIEFKEFGVGVRFLPTVLASDRINLLLNVSVSDLIAANNVVIAQSGTSDFFIPALSKRSASSTIELADGQTIAIAGLLSETTRDSIDKFPGLGDIPVLGQLFKSKEFIKGETELVILVTPHLAKPLPPGNVPLPGSGMGETPTDMEFYLSQPTGQTKNDGRDEAAAVEYAATQRLSDGHFGHVIKE